MGRVELYHPVTEDKAQEFVDATYSASDENMDEDAQQQEKDRQVQHLIQAAAQNRAWRDSRSADERLRLESEPFAVVDDGEEDDTDASA